MRIAVIGSGISGLTAAYLLSRRHEVAVFEANDYIGGHTHTVPVKTEDEEHAVDTGFIVFNERNYPNFTRLLALLGVPSQPTSMSFSVRSDRSGLEYNGTSINRLFVQRSNLLKPSFHRMVRDILRFNREAEETVLGMADDMTVRQFVEQHGYSNEFAEQYLIPLGASLWSSPARIFRRFPIRFVVEFLANHSMLQANGRPTWRVVRGGSWKYVEKLTAPFRDRVRLQCPVHAVERRPDGVQVAYQGGSESFDEVVFSCHSDQALRMLRADSSPQERTLLQAFPYQANAAVLHTDPSVLPKRRKAWASWNYHVPEHDRDSVSVTYNMNILQSLRSSSVFNVTLNETDSIAPERVLGRYSYEHPVFTSSRSAAQQRHGEVIRNNRTSFCGAYWGYGFHEDGVRTALAVGAAYGEVLS